MMDELSSFPPGWMLRWQHGWFRPAPELVSDYPWEGSPDVRFLVSARHVSVRWDP